jgi:nucleoside-triphosphatase
VALLLTGRPGVGKTTVLRVAARQLARFHPAGFYTEEIRVGRERRGFRLITFDGEEAIIAHVDLPPPRISKYGVDVAAIDRFAASLSLDAAGDKPLDSARDKPNRRDRSSIYLVDEIGKMECLSAVFVDVMRRVVESGRPLVATVAERGGGFIAEVKRRRDVEMWTVTQSTRDTLPDRIVSWIQVRVHA